MVGFLGGGGGGGGGGMGLRWVQLSAKTLFNPPSFFLPEVPVPYFVTERKDTKTAPSSPSSIRTHTLVEIRIELAAQQHLCPLAFLYNVL